MERKIEKGERCGVLHKSIVLALFFYYSMCTTYRQIDKSRETGYRMVYAERLKERERGRERQTDRQRQKETDI